MAQFQSPVRAMAATSTMMNAKGTEVTPRSCVSTRNKVSAMKADSMNTSPWAKFTMPMMPKTIV